MFNKIINSIKNNFSKRIFIINVRRRLSAWKLSQKTHKLSWSGIKSFFMEFFFLKSKWISQKLRQHNSERVVASLTKNANYVVDCERKEQKHKQSEWKFYDNLIAIQMIFCLSLFMQLQLADGSNVNNAWADFNVVQNHSTWKCFHELKLYRINFSYLSHSNCTHGFTKIQAIQFGILKFSLLL